jgi:hypothetical protein
MAKSPWQRIENNAIFRVPHRKKPIKPPEPSQIPYEAYQMNDDPVCQGCGTPLSDDETYACADCADWWAMMGHDIERREGDEAPEEP